jgi:hypothetical protein
VGREKNVESIFTFTKPANAWESFEAAAAAAVGGAEKKLRVFFASLLRQKPKPHGTAKPFMLRYQRSIHNSVNKILARSAEKSAPERFHSMKWMLMLC